MCLYNKNQEKFNHLYKTASDIIFILETNLGYDALPTLNGFTLFSNPNNKICDYGGIACYVKNSLASHLFQIKYNLSHIAFRISTVPGFMFIGAYIQPEGARYFGKC